MKTVLITGSSGFIGYHLTKRLLNEGNYKIIGIDNMNDYYDTKLKDYRLDELSKYDNYIFIKCDISDKELINKVFNEYKPNIVVNLAAQAGVRYSIENPDAYIKSNIIGFYNILEACKNNPVEHLVYASSSSVYGDNNGSMPCSEDVNTDKPKSLYAATKKCDEVLAYSYCNMYNIPSTGLRFFTVYGPAGRPDMAYFSFTNKLINNEKIQLYNNGELKRDFTYIDDVVESIKRIIDNKPKELYNIYNIGNENPVNIKDFVDTLFNQLERENVIKDNYDLKDKIEFVEMQNGDVCETYSNTDNLSKTLSYKPTTKLEDGLKNFVQWHNDYYNKNRNE